MSEREKILGRIREALSVPAPVPGSHDHQAPPVLQHRDDDVTRWLPAVGDTPEERVERFRANAIELRADFHFFDTREEAGAKLLEIATAAGWKKVASHRGDLTDGACAALGLPLLRTDEPYDVHALEACDAGITECDALVAQTGTVIVTSRSAGGRALSVLPPHHVVLARREQLVRDLPAAFALLKENYAGNFPSFMSLITGPSRTGDIERILVLGAHGPKKLTILCF